MATRLLTFRATISGVSADVAVVFQCIPCLCQFDVKRCHCCRVLVHSLLRVLASVEIIYIAMRKGDSASESKFLQSLQFLLNIEKVPFLC